MFANQKIIVTVLSYVLVAQVPFSDGAFSSTDIPTSLNACTFSCDFSAAIDAGCFVTDTGCVCASGTSGLFACYQQNCNADDFATATQSWNATCAALGIDVSTATLTIGPATATSVDSTTDSTPVTSAVTGMITMTTATSSSTTSSATSKSGAMALSAPFSFGTLIGTIVASAGVLVGAAFVL